MISLKKEIQIFAVLFIVSSVIIHFSTWLSHPILHLQELSTHAMPYHPLLYVCLIYIVIAVLRSVFMLCIKVFRK